MAGKLKATALGRVLITARELDSVRGANIRLQKILGRKMYYQKGNKWYYNVHGLSNNTISELNRIADKIERAVHSMKN